MECSFRKGAQKQTICLEPYNSQTPETPSGEVGKQLIVNLSSDQALWLWTSTFVLTPIYMLSFHALSIEFFHI